MNKNNRLNKILLGLGLVIVIVIIVALISTVKKPNNSGNQLHIVAAENFWGSLVSQIAGDKATTFSIVSDPNADPHEYEASSVDAKAIANANYVVINGLGYDNWANSLINASVNHNRVVLNVGSYVGLSPGDNPHLWYSPTYVKEAVAEMTNNLSSIQPSSRTYFEHNQQVLLSNMQPYLNQINYIAQHFSGDPVASTEQIFIYMAQAMKLNLISPLSFMQAVAEGNDPPASSVVTFTNQLSQNSVNLLVYNTQTITPLTSSMKSLAHSSNIPVVGVSETIQPTNLNFEDWMLKTVTNIRQALQSNHG